MINNLGQPFRYGPAATTHFRGELPEMPILLNPQITLQIEQVFLTCFLEGNFVVFFFLKQRPVPFFGALRQQDAFFWSKLKTVTGHGRPFLSEDRVVLEKTAAA